MRRPQPDYICVAERIVLIPGPADPPLRPGPGRRANPLTRSIVVDILTAHITAGRAEHQVLLRSNGAISQLRGRTEAGPGPVEVMIPTRISNLEENRDLKWLVCPALRSDISPLASPAASGVPRVPDVICLGLVDSRFINLSHSITWPE